MRVWFHEAALVELAWEVQYYAKFNPQLGARFATVVERALVIATEFPDMGSPHRYGTRRVFPKRFPFRPCTYIAVMKFWCWQSRRTTGSQVTGVPGWSGDSMSMDTNPQQQVAALPQCVSVVARSFLR